MQCLFLFSVLYRIGPPFFHGSYSVIVRTVHEKSFTEVEEYTDRKLTWTTFCGLHRVTEHVAKVSHLAEAVYQYFSCVTRLSVFEVPDQVQHKPG